MLKVQMTIFPHLCEYVDLTQTSNSFTFLVMIVPFTELKSGSGLAGFRSKLIVAYVILETKNDVLIKDIILISIRERDRYRVTRLIVINIC